MENATITLTVDELNYLGELVTKSMRDLDGARNYLNASQPSDYESEMIRVQHDLQLAENVNSKFANHWF